MRGIALVLCFMVFGCQDGCGKSGAESLSAKGSEESTATPTDRLGGQGNENEGKETRGARETPKVWLETQGSFGGKDKLRVALVSTSDSYQLVAGDMHLDIEVPPSSKFFWDKQAELKIVKLGAKEADTALLLSTPTEEDEDPPNTHQIFVVLDGKLKQVFSKKVGNYNPVPLSFPGDGTFRYLEDSWTACMREKPKKKVTRQWVHYRLETSPAVTGAPSFVESKRKPGEKFNCDDLAG